MSIRPLKKGNEEFLPNEVIMEILSKLPTVSVLRFRSVSKLWFNILRDEFFRNLHSEVLLRPGSPLPSHPEILFSTVRIQKQHKKQQLIITFSTLRSTSHHTITIFSDKSGRFSASPGKLDYMDVLPAMHCNGLLVIVPSKRLMDWPMIVCNPLTREHLALPPCATLCVSCYYCVGLGFAPLSRQYKVVRIHFVKDSAKPSSFNVRKGVAEVYILGDTRWRVVDPHVGLSRGHIGRYSGLYANGKIYWVILEHQVNKLCLLSFDVEREQASVIGNLSSIVGNSHCFKLAQLGSGVSLLMNHNSKEIDVWMLKDNCNSRDNNCLWDIRHRIRLPDGSVSLEDIHFPWNPHNIWEFGDGDLLIVVGGTIIRRFCDGRISYIRSEHGRCFNRSIWLLCCGYRPSLVSLERYGCSTGGIVVNDGLVSPPNIQIPILPTT